MRSFCTWHVSKTGATGRLVTGRDRTHAQLQPSRMQPGADRDEGRRPGTDSGGATMAKVRRRLHSTTTRSRSQRRTGTQSGRHTATARVAQSVSAMAQARQLGQYNSRAFVGHPSFTHLSLQYHPLLRPYANLVHTCLRSGPTSVWALAPSRPVPHLQARAIALVPHIHANCQLIRSIAKPLPADPSQAVDS